MYTTEKEAAEKWCCQARHEAVAQADRKIMVPCIGSGCMAWRWNFSALEEVDLSKRRGYCGLAGRLEW
ncbi:hypothetical protein [Candidatus Magnetaquiglobus chichijimensis]|uniref:hypothetical protein n=1 Tax=Candidatus Magnetaquiglobus chichijimensis TaxID=3141448 RepID=UPI003B979E37